MSDNEITDEFTVEIYCDDSSHDEPELVDVFQFSDGYWECLDPDGLAARGYFDAEDGENPLKGAGKARRVLKGDTYLGRSVHRSVAYHPAGRIKYKFACRCGRNVPSRHPKRVHVILDTLARHGQSKITLTFLAAILRSTSDRWSGKNT